MTKLARVHSGTSKLALGVVLGLLGAGCGDLLTETITDSCDGTSQGVRFCSQWTGPAIEVMAMQTTCTSSLKGTFRTGSCDSKGAVGGCRVVAAGITTLSWFYGGTAAVVMASCTQQKGTFVAAP